MLVNRSNYFQKYYPWLLAVRMKTLTASFVPVLCGTVISLEAKPFQFALTFVILIFATSLQILSNLANDYCDHFRGIDTKERVGPVRVTNSGLVSPEKMRLAIILNIFFIFLIGLYLASISSYWVVLVTLISIASAYYYSGGSHPYGSIGLGELFVFIFFGPVTVLGTYYLLTHQFSLDALFVGISLGLISSALLVANNIRDYQQDLLANKKTLVVRFGRLFGKFEYLSLIILAAIVPWLDSNLVKLHPYSLVSSVVVLIAVPSLNIIFNYSNPAQLNSVMGKTAFYIIIFGLIFSLGFIAS